jgi:hypothetical protein
MSFERRSVGKLISSIALANQGSIRRIAAARSMHFFADSRSSRRPLFTAVKISATAARSRSSVGSAFTDPRPLCGAFSSHTGLVPRWARGFDALTEDSVRIMESGTLAIET